VPTVADINITRLNHVYRGLMMALGGDVVATRMAEHYHEILAQLSLLTAIKSYRSIATTLLREGGREDASAEGGVVMQWDAICWLIKSVSEDICSLRTSEQYSLAIVEAAQRWLNELELEVKLPAQIASQYAVLDALKTSIEKLKAT
jgi:hypothetical protein